MNDRTAIKRAPDDEEIQITKSKTGTRIKNSKWAIRRYGNLIPDYGVYLKANILCSPR